MLLNFQYFINCLDKQNVTYYSQTNINLYKYLAVIVGLPILVTETIKDTEEITCMRQATKYNWICQYYMATKFKV